MLPDELQTKLLNDLSKSGFRSEIDCMKILKRSGWASSGSAAYFDLDNEITRNIDIQAHVIESKNRAQKGGIEVEYLLNIEVKKSERPWIVFKAEEKYRGTGDAWNNPTVAKNLPCNQSELVPSFRLLSIREELKWLGYSVHEAFKEPNDSGRWFSAAVTACKACFDYVQREPFVGISATTMFEGITFLLVTQPVVVLDGPLISVGMHQNGDLHFEEIAYAPFEFEFGTAKYKKNSYRVDLVSLKNLEAYLGLTKKRSESLFDNLVEFSTRSIVTPESRSDG